MLPWLISADPGADTGSRLGLEIGIGIAAGVVLLLGVSVLM